MKKSLTALFATIALTALCVTPVFATVENLDAEKALIQKHADGISNSIATLVSYDNNCGEDAKNAMNALVNGFDRDVKYSITQEQDNYIKYLQACLGNAIETERIKKQNVGALTDLVKVNPSFQGQLDAAVVEYNNAVAARMAAETRINEVKAQFIELNNSIIAGNNAKYAGDKDAR